MGLVNMAEMGQVGKMCGEEMLGLAVEKCGWRHTVSKNGGAPLKLTWTCSKPQLEVNVSDEFCVQGKARVPGHVQLIRGPSFEAQSAVHSANFCHHQVPCL